MSLEKKTVFILVDTSFLRSVSFGDPDFRKLLEYSKNQVVKIFVPHIAWEERRTQFLEKACEKVGKVTTAFTKLEAENRSSIKFAKRSLVQWLPTTDWSAKCAQQCKILVWSRESLDLPKLLNER